MKRINIIWTIVALLGIMLAVCTADGSNGEIGLRACGIAAFGIGAWLGGWMDTKEKGTSHDN